MDLIELYRKTKNDSDKERTHTYISNFYNEKFKPFKDKKIKILEIGILQGHSLKLWEEYFPNAEIFGIDIQNIIEHSFGERVKIIFGNAYSLEFINKVQEAFGKFDIIIDDGPHTLETQQFFLKNYPLLLKDSDSLIILEDVYSKAFEVLKQEFSDFNIIDLRDKIKNEYNSVIFYK
jgi:23S rRNA U2552 (ribose-2'-O)-methylase RlmE/FtsJ